MTVSLTDYSGVSVLIKSFTVSVACTVQTLIFTTSPPVLTTVQIGIDALPFSILFATEQTPNCAQSPVFTLEPIFGLFLITKNLDGLSGVISISGATLSSLSTFEMTLNADSNDQTA
jgi:hypothetical protein